MMMSSRIWNDILEGEKFVVFELLLKERMVLRCELIVS